jgi:diadenosine tetraphosphatase ApaH/serine/threonine PP2A family protein phosphatase
MTRVAVLADVHGNVPALAAVLADLDAQAPDEVLVGGDLVGRGPQGAEVVRRLAARGWPSVKGNHEDYMLDFRRGQVPEDWLFTDEWSAARWMAAELGEGEAAYIAELPFSLTAALAPELRLVHGSPRSANEGIGPWLSDGQIEAQLARVAEPVLICGHTHRPLLRRFDSGLVVNVGSVGLPFNGDPRAQYAVFEGDGGVWEVEFRQVEYDRGKTLEIYETSGFLAAGGATARLLRLELEHAAPFLVPFLRWAEAQGVKPEPGRIAEFLEFYQPGEPMGHFFGRLAELA